MSPDSFDTDRTAADDPTYDLLLLLDELESVREELLELGVTTTDDLAGRADPAAIETLARMRALDLRSLADLTARIVALHRRLDAESRPS